MAFFGRLTQGKKRRSLDAAEYAAKKQKAEEKLAESEQLHKEAEMLMRELAEERGKNHYAEMVYLALSETRGKK